LPKAPLDLVSGRRRGPAASIARAALRAASWPYGLVIRLRNRLYDAEALTAARLGVPVVSVGNITVGGTGKTPLVIWIAGELVDAGYRPLVVSRGYGPKLERQPGDRRPVVGRMNDECGVIAERAPQAEQAIGPDRTSVAREGLERTSADVVVLDDGFQHRRLARDLDVVCLGAKDSFGLGYLLPRGLLREPPSSLARADFVVVTSGEPLPEDESEALGAEIGAFTDAPVVEASYRPSAVVDLAEGRDLGLERLQGTKVVAAAGLANPDAFWETVGALGAVCAETVALADHVAYDEALVGDLVDRCRRTGADALLVTQKDAVKLKALETGGAPVWFVGVDLVFSRGEDVLRGALRDLPYGDAREE
jgi:tetraacyldisaccharide 4'-kinase